MYLDTSGWRRDAGEPSRKPKLTPRQEKAALWIAVGIVLLAFLSPIAGVTVFDGIAAAARR